MSQYSRYKNQFEKPVEFPANLKGKNLPIINLSRNNYLKTKPATPLEFRYENNVKILRIYFDSPTFDLITKDERAKFEEADAKEWKNIYDVGSVDVIPPKKANLLRNNCPERIVTS